ncbi:hypothetical protein [Methylophilus sp. 5]|uniref:hypothetical protein n=1 Tax=Methylophilus sp. 5 TaxID=1112274 RepID=UPI00048E9023|nr:hypothetical protein [Methylophilus sp. 5]
MRNLGVFVVIVSVLSACSVNMVRLGVYKNKAQLIGLDGTVYVGSILINDISNDGDIEFETSPYGALAGKWTATSAAAPVVVRPGSTDSPAVDAGVRRAYSGKSFLVANQKAVLNCDFKANIEGDGLLGSVFVIGDGVCVDDQKRVIPIQFFKS